mgnify:CR=1 FL=1
MGMKPVKVSQLNSYIKRILQTDPLLGNISVTGEATGTYNCIAYSMGITNKWIDPESFYNDFIEQYKNAKTLYGSSCNYEQTSTEGSNATVDGWGTSSIDMTHGSVVYSSGTWESKLGRYLRITHKRSELSGTLYGRILVSFIESRTKTDMSEIKELAKQIAQEDIELSDAEKQAVIDKAANRCCAMSSVMLLIYENLAGACGPFVFSLYGNTAFYRMAGFDAVCYT